MIDEEHFLFLAKEELKRVDHLIFVSLKYTRTVDVLKNTLGRLITCFDCIIDGLLKEAVEKRMIGEIPQANLKKCEALRKLHKDKEIMNEFIDFYLLLRKINKADYDKTNEFRRHVTLIAHTEDQGNINVDIDIITEYYRKAQRIMEEMERLFVC